MGSIAVKAAVLMAVAANEVEFNCPWCNTRLALSRSDFASERAVLCPKCNNPIDLDIQRRLARTQPQAPARAVAAPPTQPPAPRRQVTVSKPPPPLHPPPPPKKAPPASLHPQAHAAPKTGDLSIPPPESLDWSKPLDINASFRATPVPERTAAPPSSAPTPNAPSAFGGKLRCQACGFENAKVPPEFSFGTSQKCAWCGKPLPES